VNEEVTCDSKHRYTSYTAPAQKPRHSSYKTKRENKAICHPPALVNIADRLGVRMSFTPATSAEPQLPVLRLRLAMCAPTSDDEQAVSILREGPDSAST
jgi:hypothetical protein